MKKSIIPISLIMLAIVAISLAGCTTSNSGALTLEEHPLQGTLQVEPLVITPLEGTQEEMLKTHSSERSQTFPDNYTTIDGNMALSATLNGKPLVAGQTFSNNYSESYVWVTQAGTEIYRISTGPASPLNNLIGLWVYEGHWALETALVDLAGGDVTPFALGQVTIDGVLQNKTRGYDETFGLQTITGKLFYFFKKDGKLGYFYNGQETMLKYEEIPHYNCCSASALNPIQAQNMQAFFARTGDTWYYVELGNFNK
jgi:hypothetical protein